MGPRWGGGWGAVQFSGPLGKKCKGALHLPAGQARCCRLGATPGLRGAGLRPVCHIPQTPDRGGRRAREGCCSWDPFPACMQPPSHSPLLTSRAGQVAERQPSGADHLSEKSQGDRLTSADGPPTGSPGQAGIRALRALWSPDTFIWTSSCLP